MLHPGPLIREAAVDVAVEPGASPAIDLAAAAADPVHRFLRSAWFGAAANGTPLVTLTARRACSGEPLAAIPLTRRRRAFLSLSEVPGSYWPFRSFPLARDASETELAALLASPEARSALGRAWRIGPIHADDPTGLRLAAAARRGGWSVLPRGLARCYVVDLKRLTAGGSWPSSKTLRKNRWLERRLAEAGELTFTRVNGAAWSGQVLDLLAGIERESWVGKSEPGDAKFLNAANRRVWERAISDPLIAERLGCSLLHVGGVPAAFTFSLESGGTLYFIANSYSEKFADRSPGRILLYRDLQQAAEAGLSRISWGAGDPGYKSEMGAEPGPEIVDYLVVRGPLLAALARPLWQRGRGPSA